MKRGWWEVISYKNGSWKLSCTIEPNDVDLEHITRLIGEGYNQGEIIQQVEQEA